jgi:MFS family permease
VNLPPRVALCPHPKAFERLEEDSTQQSKQGDERCRNQFTDGCPLTHDYVVFYSLSAAVFLVAGPFYGWITDRYGPLVGIASRSAANTGSSLMYVASPTFVGMAARSVDDVGKAAFRPAWASAITDIAAKDPPRKGRRLGTLDAMQEIGEIAGPALAGILWQTGGVSALFGVRITIAIVAEISAITVFCELHNYRPRLRILTRVRKNRRRRSV